MPLTRDEKDAIGRIAQFSLVAAVIGFAIGGLLVGLVTSRLYKNDAVTHGYAEYYVNPIDSTLRWQWLGEENSE